MTQASQEVIRVGVVDDQRLFVHGMSMLVQSQPDLALVCSATNGRDALEAIRTSAPDVVLMDIRMPIMNGLEVTRRLNAGVHVEGRRNPEVVVLTTFRQEEAVLQSLRSGAAAFLTKDATPELVLETIRAVHRGDGGPEPIRALLERHGRLDRHPAPEEAIAVLTPREREIFLLAAKGLSNAEIATSAFVAEATVKTHIGRILAKLDLQSRTQIVILAYEKGLVSF